MHVFKKLHAFVAAIPLLVTTSAFADTSIVLDMPIDCDLGQNCFLQQMPDMDLSDAVRDPFGGIATYNGHNGTDFRLRYFSDIDKNVPVLASAEGTVSRLRDGVPDVIIRTQADRDRVRDHECGNGIIIKHNDGWQTQYCHLKNGSVKVREGQQVKAGDVLAHVGSSGMAEFPHVHIGLTRNVRPVDPFSGSALLAMKQPSAKISNDLWGNDQVFQAGLKSAQILDMGLSGGAVEHDALIDKRPANASPNSGAFVGWVSLINLQKGDIVRLQLETPDKKTTVRNESKPLERAKASYSLYAGRRGSPEPGDYKLGIAVVRDGALAVFEEQVFTVK